MEKKKKRKKTRKPKVVLNRKQVIVLAVAIIAVCVCMLCVTILTLPSSASAEKENIAEQIVVPPLQESSKSKVQENNEKITIPKKEHSAEKERSIPVSPVQQKENVSSSNQEPLQIQEPAVQSQSPFDIVPPANKNATLVVVLDDGGQNLVHLQHFLDLPFPLDVAVLPGLQYSVESARRVRNSGKELMLHQPMQALNLDVNPGPNAITPDMHTYDIESLVLKNIEEIGPVAGLNNHEGSLITESAVKIGVVLDVCSSTGIFFLDSRTSAATKAPQAAMERGIHIWERDVFLDNTQVKADIIAQIIQGAKIANRDGFAIMIGHIWSSESLATILLEMYEELSKKGYRFSTVGGLNENFGD